MKTPPLTCTRDDEVRKVYYAILKVTKRLIATVEQHELRYTLVRENKHTTTGVVHELLSPIFYLRLEVQQDNTLAICYGLEACAEFMHLTMPFARTIYRLTMKEATTNNIESCISTRYYVHNPDELYAYMEDRCKYHTFELVKHRPAARHSKQVLRVA